jgi:LPXTG-site transpeptidase (sortase) family protein
MRDLLLCLLITINLMIYGFIGLNYGAFEKVISYKTNVPNNSSQITTNYSLQTPQPQASSKSLTLNSSKKSLSSWQGTLSIPSLNIEAPIQHQAETSVADIQDVLSQGTMSLSPFIPPSKTDRMIVFGHSSDYRWNDNAYSNIFALLPQIKVGETISLTHQNQRFDYSVSRTEITAPDLKPIVENDPEHNELVLSTCYPIGFFSERFNVIAVPTFIAPETQVSPETPKPKNEMRNKIQI